MQEQVPIHDGDQSPDRAIRFRIGINLGDAIADGTDLHGDAVNVAARLQAECPPGGICVTRSVRDHIHGRLDLAFGAWNTQSEEHQPAGRGVPNKDQRDTRSWSLQRIRYPAASRSAIDRSSAVPEHEWR